MKITLSPVFFIYAFGIGIFLASCGSDSGDADITKTTPVDSTKAAIINVGGKLFSIPSPIQTAILAKESGVKYHAEMLNSYRNVPNYTSRWQKAMNLGIFGADLAYASLYEDNQSAIHYFKAIERLANELDITGALDRDLIERIGSNLGNSDSLLVLSTRFYRQADAYLKENQRYDVATLILAGGWIEAAHISAQAAVEGNAEARQRLAEQQKPLKDIINLLKSTNESTSIPEITADFDSLATAFSSVKSDYQFKRSETIPEKKLTNIKSETTYNISDSTVSAVAKRVQEIRTKITLR